MSRTKRKLPGWYKDGEFTEGFKEDLERGLIRIPKNLPESRSEIWGQKAKAFRKRQIKRKQRRESEETNGFE